MTDSLDPHSRHIEIDAGVISGAEDPADIGQSLFMVLLIEANGSYAMLWGGRDRMDASRVAGEMASDFGVPVIDKTGRPN